MLALVVPSRMQFIRSSCFLFLAILICQRFDISSAVAESAEGGMILLNSPIHVHFSVRLFSVDEGRMLKRSVEFMGQRVSYPQFLRLMAIQREVIRMDKVIKSMMQTYDPEELAQNPYWIELLDLFASLEKMLPENYERTI